jgi:hypothetical protein
MRKWVMSHINWVCATMLIVPVIVTVVGALSRSDVVGYVSGALSLSIFSVLFQALGACSKEQIQEMGIIPLYILAFRNSRKIHYGLLIVLWIQGWAWSDWTWRSLVAATVAFFLIQILSRVDGKFDAEKEVNVAQ